MRRFLARPLTVLAIAAVLAGSACGKTATTILAIDKATAERIVITSADLPGSAPNRSTTTTALIPSTAA